MENTARVFYMLGTGANQINYDDANKYLKTLFGRCTQGFIEIRPIPDPGQTLRKWIPLSNIVAPTVPVDKDIFVGVATRREGGGKKEDILEIPALIVDIDFKDIERSEAEKRIAAFKFKPSMVVESGHGLHTYFSLKTPATAADIPKIEDINDRLAFHFGGDTAAKEAARILRLPGTYNVKREPVIVTISSINDNTYKIDDFDFLLPRPDPPKPAVSGKVQDWYTGLLEGVPQGKRTNATMRLLGRYIEKGLTENEAMIVLSQWNEKNIPPLVHDELEKTVTSAYRSYGGNAWSVVNKGNSLDYKSLIEASVMSLSELVNMPIEQKPCIINPWLRAGEISMISADRGVGKTMLALSIAMAATREMPIGKWTPGDPTGCLYLDGEMSAYDIRKRLINLQNGLLRREVARFELLCTDIMRSQEKASPKLVDPNWRKGIIDYLKKTRILGC